MKTFKLYLLLIIARILSIAIKIRGKSSGTSFIGMVILKLNPNFIREVSNSVKTTITVTGTNGKTTTSGILSHLIKNTKHSLLNNSKGANMLTGIANAFALSVKPGKKYDYAVLESDEAYLSKLYDNINADYLVVTNLFRDQLDRYGELATTAKKIQTAIDKNKNLQLVLNADDPLVVNFKPLGTKKPIYFGFNHIEYIGQNTQSNAPIEAITCPLCGRDLIYNDRFYAQQGHYFCKCGYRRPECKYNADVEIYRNYSQITMTVDDKTYSFRVPLVGLYNAYNALAAIAVSFENGITNIQKALDSYKSEFGRSEVKKINGKTAIIQLIKNPTGASEVLKTVDLESSILIAINDNYADGRDVSWLWDADFELLRGAKRPIYTSGERAYDMAIRLKYAGIKDIKVVQNIDDAIERVSSDKNTENITILPTYTALLHINNKGA